MAPETFSKLIMFFSPFTHCGPAPLTLLSLDHQTSIPQDLCMCSYFCLEYLSLTRLGSFPIFFPPDTRFPLREAFLDCLCWVVSDCPSEAPSTPLYTVLFWEAPAGFRASPGILLDQEVRGSGDFFLGSRSDDSYGWVVCLYWKLLPRGCFL